MSICQDKTISDSQNRSRKPRAESPMREQVELIQHKNDNLKSVISQMEICEENRILKAKMTKMETAVKKLIQLAGTERLSSSFELAIKELVENEQTSEGVLSNRSKDNIPRCNVVKVNNKNRNSILKDISDDPRMIQQEENLKRHFQEASEKKMKVALADSEFEVKRLSEDFAMFKTMHELQRAKLIKESEVKILQLKCQIEEQNQNWINRFDIRDKEFHAEGEVLKQKFQQQNLNTKQKLQKELSACKAQFQISKSEAIQVLEKKHGQQVRKLQADRDNDLQKIIDNHQKEMKEILFKHEKEVGKLRRQTEIMLLAVRSQRKTEQNMHEATKIQMNKMKEKLYGELYEVRRENEALEIQLMKLQKEKKGLEIALEENRVHLAKVVSANEINLASMKQQYQKREEELKQMMKTKVSEIVQRQLEKADELGGNIKVLEQKHIEQVELFSTQMEQIKNCYQERPSRQEDLQMIRQLEQKLWKRENDLELVCQELKWHRLELENKEETYNKIFTNGYNVNINELKFPAERCANKINTKEFKFRRVAKSLLTQKDHRNSSGKLIHANLKIL